MKTARARTIHARRLLETGVDPSENRRAAKAAQMEGAPARACGARSARTRLQPDGALAERRKMMRSWADYLDKLKNGAEVIPILKAG